MSVSNAIIAVFSGAKAVITAVRGVVSRVWAVAAPASAAQRTAPIAFAIFVKDMGALFADGLAMMPGAGPPRQGVRSQISHLQKESLQRVPSRGRGYGEKKEAK